MNAGIAPFLSKERADSIGFLAGGGEMGERTRRFDWSKSPVGIIQSWPQNLKTAVSICLGSRHPMVVWWGREELTQFYNDAYISFLGSNKHPAYLGRSARECWREIWEIIDPMLQGVFGTGQATWSEDLLFVLNRHLPREEAYFTFSYSPILADDGSVAGIFCACNETTHRVLGERRLRTLRDLNRVVAEAKSVVEACEVAARILGENRGDIPFALIYLLGSDGRHARLMAVTGLERGNACAPETIELTGTAGLAPVWPLGEVTESGAPELISNLSARPASLPGGLWPEPTDAALVVPISAPGQARPAGFLISGLSPRRIIDADYRSFLDLVAGHIGTSVMNARAYDEERKRAETLAQLDRAKTLFFSNVSHEFRTPLTLLLGPVEVAAADSATPAPVRKQLELAHRNALRLLKLVNSLLDFSRIEAGRMKASYEATDLSATTRDLASNFRSAIERAGLDFIVECEDLGEPVFIDRDLWEKIVLNLLSNAFKFTLAGSISVRVQRNDSRVVLEVSDTGCGIAAHEMPRLFERFHRIEGARSRTQEGSGIGLALVRELVKLHGGSIDVESEIDRGTSFRVYLPFGSDHLPRERIRAARGGTSTAIGAEAFVQEALRWVPEGPENAISTGLSPHTGRENAAADLRFAATFGARIVLADDNADMRTYLSTLLAPYYIVEAVPDGEQALATARRQTPHLIISDIMMPRLDGLALLRALRADERLRAVPVILLSARAGDEARIAGLGCGADDYLVKPLNVGELLARVGSLLELTRLRRERSEELRQILETAAVGLTRLDSSNRYITANSAYARIIGRPLSQIIGNTVTEVLGEDVAKALRPHTDRVLKGETVEYEMQLPDAIGSKWIHAISTPWREADGSVTGWVASISDVSARKRSEELLQRNEIALRQADRQKDEFLAMLAHELRNPLAPIRNSNELLTKLLTATDPRVESAIAITRRQVNQLTRLVDDLLDVSRVTHGRIELKRRAVHLTNIIEQALEATQPLFRERSHRVSVTAASHAHLYVSADPARLMQCIVNVLTNAAKYTDAGGDIRIHAHATNSQAIVEISDNGVGIPPDLLPRVFDLFVQSGRTIDRSQGGLGIGLSVVKRLIEMHGGDIQAHSAGAGQGSTFEIRLPLLRQSEVVDSNSEVLPTVAPTRILVVDDNKDSAHSLAALLQLQGHEVETAHDATAALRCAATFKPRIVLLDIGLPEMDGYEVARRLRRMSELNALRLVAVTGYGQPEDRQRAKSAGFDDHLVKPMDLTSVAHAIARISHSTT